MSAIVRAKLLIVDDEPAQMKALCDTLELEGYLAHGHTSATQALTALREDGYDLVLTDLSMPEMDGIAFLEAVRRIDNHVPAIVMTGHGSVDTAVAAMKAGALDYILKPFTLRMILPVLDRALTIRTLRTENVQLRRAEETIRRLNATLERCVESRTVQLRETNRELEAFSHSVSHDLRAPLRALDGFAGILLQEYGERIDERGRGYLQRIADATARMRGLIDDLLRLSHVTGTELRVREFDLSAMARGIVEDLRAREPERRVDVSIEPNLVCSADRELARIALDNLFGNAWKFTRHVAQPRIEFGQGEGAPPVFFIRDNGAGFDEAHAEHLFTPFRRLHSAEEFPGTGIGLSIVQRIVHRHGGSVWARGAVGWGATFNFTFGEGDAALSLKTVAGG